ncbi:MAG: hypothetical protein ABEH38_08425 [Flavobacteriales bacterium]
MQFRMLFLLLLLNGASFHAFAQDKAELVDEQDTETQWLGLDFSHFKIKGEDVEPDKLREYMISWNTLVTDEEEKYDLERFFNKDEVENNIDPALKRIEKLDPEKRISESISGEYEMEEKKVEQIAKAYKMEDPEDELGILFVMEEFNKVKEYGSMYICFIELSSGAILKKEHFKTNPGGIGFRNFWARTYFNAMKEYQEGGD